MYQGYLIKVGEYSIPLSIIRAETYSCTYNSQDVDSYRDANGYLHREALDNYVPKVEFNVVPMLSNQQLSSFLANIRSQYTNATERRVVASVYVPEIDDYVVQDMYMADFTPEIYFANNAFIQYKEFRMAFIGYGKPSTETEETE